MVAFSPTLIRPVANGCLNATLPHVRGGDSRLNGPLTVPRTDGGKPFRSVAFDAVQSKAEIYPFMTQAMHDK